jgi:hypothetical protein
MPNGETYMGGLTIMTMGGGTYTATGVVGIGTGAFDGALVGACVGRFVGTLVGDLVGALVGPFVGLLVGACMGCLGAALVGEAGAFVGATGALVKDPGGLDGALPVGTLVGDAGVTGEVGVLGARVPLGSMGAMLCMGALGVFVGTGALGALVANGVAVVGAAVRGDGIERGPTTGNVTGTGAAVGTCKGRGEVTGVGTATGKGARAETGTEVMGEVAGVAVIGVEVATLGEVAGEFTWATAGALVGNLVDAVTGPVTEEHAPQDHPFLIQYETGRNTLHCTLQESPFVWCIVVPRTSQRRQELLEGQVSLKDEPLGVNLVRKSRARKLPYGEQSPGRVRLLGFWDCWVLLRQLWVRTIALRVFTSWP